MKQLSEWFRAKCENFRARFGNHVPCLFWRWIDRAGMCDQSRTNTTLVLAPLSGRPRRRYQPLAAELVAFFIQNTVERASTILASGTFCADSSTKRGTNSLKFVRDRRTFPCGIYNLKKTRIIISFRSEVVKMPHFASLILRVVFTRNVL